MGMEMGKMGKSGIPMLLLLLVLSTLCPTTGTIQAPLLILEGPEQDGIRLRCLSDRPFSEVRLLWTDGNGENLTGTPSPGDGGNAGSSLLLRPGAGNAAACRALEPRLSAAAESSVVIGDVFFPSTSPWLPAFVMLLIFGIVLVLAAAYKIRRNNQIIARERKAQQEIREEIEDLNEELEEEKKKFQKENQEMAKKIEHIQAQLDFRRAQSHAESLTLDERCTHPSLAIRGQSLILSPNSASQTPPGAVAVAREGFSEGQHYWEVEVEEPKAEAEVGGDRSGWELGVVAEEIRDSLRTSGAELPEVKEQSSGAGFPEEKVLRLGYSRGEFRLPGGKLERTSGTGSPEVKEGISRSSDRNSGTGSPEVKEGISRSSDRNSGSGSLEVKEGISGFPRGSSGCFRVVGVFLDLEFRTLSFFDADGKSLLGSVPVKISGKLFPFFRPGGSSVGVRSVGV